MSRFNTLRSAGPAADSINRAGGQAYAQDPKLALVSLLVTSMVRDQYYRPEGESLANLKQLIDAVPLEFAAKAAIVARHEYAMRTITHVAAVEIVRRSKGELWTRDFIKQVCRRGDDALEIFAYWMATYGKPVPSRLDRGLNDFFRSLDKYEIAKYQREHSEWKMLDVISMTRPRPTEAINELMKAGVTGERTREVMLTQAAGDKEKEAENWKELLASRSLGYMALLRNIKRILEMDETLLYALTAQLLNASAITKSLVLPFCFLTAVDTLQSQCAEASWLPKILQTLSKAAEMSLSNVPTFEGRTLVALDDSGSMEGTPVGGRKEDTAPRMTCAKVGGLFAAAMVKANACDFMVFSADAYYFTLNPADSLLTMCDKIPRRCLGTNFHSIFQAAKRGYDRIVIMSDMQGWMGGGAPTESFRHYIDKFGCVPRIYSVDLTGYGDMQFPAPRVYCMAGLNDRVFEMMKLLETDQNALVNRIEQVKLGPKVTAASPIEITLKG